jgi:hypothetical protein
MASGRAAAPPSVLQRGDPRIADDESVYEELPVYRGAAVIAHAKVPIDLFPSLSKTRWWLSDAGYVRSTGAGQPQLSHVVTGCDQFQSVDHIHHDKLDNRRCALRVVSAAENCQNKRKRSDRKTTSKYIGVFWNPKGRNYGAKYSTTHLGFHVTEDAAARAYNMHVSGLFASPLLNDVESDEDQEPYQARDLLMPTGVRRSGASGYRVQYRGRSLGSFRTLGDATDARRKAVDADRVAEDTRIGALEITRNEHKEAVIRTKKGEEIIVDDERWHDLMRRTWSISGQGYAVSQSAPRVTLSRYLLDQHDRTVFISYIDGNRLNNRLANLRLPTARSSVFHHRKKRRPEGCAMPYKGLTRAGDKFCVRIRIDGVVVGLGRYDDAKTAAWVYDAKCIQLHGPQCALNGVPAPDGWSLKYDRAFGPGSPSGIDPEQYAKLHPSLAGVHKAAGAAASDPLPHDGDDDDRDGDDDSHDGDDDNDDDDDAGDDGRPTAGAPHRGSTRASHGI